MAALSPVASEPGTLASVSVIDMETNDGEDYLLIDMPEAEAAPAEAPPLGRTRLSTELAQNSAA